jgi:hypothetical protein
MRDLGPLLEALELHATIRTNAPGCPGLFNNGCPEQAKNIVDHLLQWVPNQQGVL